MPFWCRLFVFLLLPSARRVRFCFRHLHSLHLSTRVCGRGANGTVKDHLLGTETTYSEEELVLLLRQKSRAAFNALYTRYSAALYGVVLKVVGDEQTAQDVLQEAFVKIWNNVEQYDATKARLYTWMMNIARNAAIDKLRSKGEIMKSKIRSEEDLVHNNEEWNMRTEQATDTIGLHKMVGELRPEQEAVVRLAYFKGYTMDEISQTLEIPVGTVKTRMRSAIKQLRTFFSG